MRIEVEGVVLLDRSDESWEDLYKDYVIDEAEAGREVPSFELTALFTAIGGWLLGKAGDELLQRWRARRERRREDNQRAEDQAAETARQEALMDRLDRIIALLEARGEGPITGRRVLEALARTDTPVAVTATTDVDADLVPTIEAHLARDSRS